MKSRILAVTILSLVASDCCLANVCVYRPPKVKQLHGVVLDTTNAPIADAVVKLSRGDEIVEESTTGDDGELDFGSMPDGKYQIHTDARGFVDSWYEVVLQDHTAHWKSVIEIKLAVGINYCDGSISVVKTAATKR
jgi:hypothetical protein